MPVVLICQHIPCGKHFAVPPSRLIQNARFCSMQCARRARPMRPLAERFWEKVHQGTPNECWLWQGAINTQGYGVLRIDKKTRPATGAVWLLTYGQWPTLFLCHTCDTPACVNPAHLWEGTQQENVSDMMDKGRHRSVTHPGLRSQGERNGMAKLRDTDYAAIRALYATGTWTYKALAQHYQLSPTGIHYIVKHQKL